MVPVRRMAVVLLSGLLILLAQSGDSARPAEEKSSNKTDDPLAVLIDSRAERQLAAAADCIAAEEWTNAVRLLQQLLDDNSDRLVHRAGRGGRAISVHAEAERMLAALPAAGRAVYQHTYAPHAAELLKKARKDSDAEQLRAIVRRYLYTESGPAALRELARKYYRAGHLHLAADSYGRLIQHLGLARWTNDDLFQGLIALRMRSTSPHADRILKQLLARTGQGVLRLRDRTVTVEQLRKEIGRAAASRQTSDWPVFGGDATRTARASGGPPFLESIWRQSLIANDSGGHEGDAVRGWIRSAEKLMHERDQPIVPAFAPIAITLTRGEKKLPLLIYRTYWGIVALNAKTNEIVWATPSSWSLQRMLSTEIGSGKPRAVDAWLHSYMRGGFYPQILFDNSALGSLSSDGKYVYAVEDFAIPPWPAYNAGFEHVGLGDGYPADIQDAIRHNRLQAFSLATSGKLTWELGGEDNSPLADCYFLGPPLPLDGLLYVLIEKKQQLCLLCLDTAAQPRVDAFHPPRIVSLQPFLRVPVSLMDDPFRRIRAAHLAYSDGILVCPTNIGTILGIDLLSGSVAWAYSYGKKNTETSLPREASRPPAARREPPPRKIPERTEPPAMEILRPVQVRKISWSWKGWKMWGSDGLTIPDASQQRTIVRFERNWKLADIPPGWVVGLDGRPTLHWGPLTVYEAFNLAFGKVGPRNQVDVIAAQPPEPERRRRDLPAGWMRDSEGRPIPNNPKPCWAASAPVIAEGKMIFTPPDAPSIHCLDLHDGFLAWSRQKKEDELYLDGVHDGKALIVSTSSVQAINLASGATLWTLPTGTPSGRGIAANGIYYLPLRESMSAKRPEICAIDMNRGQIQAHIPARPRTPGGTDFDVPGNLLFFGGDLISLTAWEVLAYPSAKARIDRISAQLAQHPDDAAALTDRAALRLAGGDTAGAIADLTNALKNKPDSAIRRRARGQLFEALSGLFERDLQSAEKYLPDYEEASRVDLEGVPAAERSQRQAEQDRRRVRYHLLVARLRASQKRLLDALEAYRDLAALGPGDDMMPLPDEPAVKVRRAIWVRGRIAELFQRATPAQRKELEEDLTRRRKDLEGRKEVRGLRDFVSLFGMDTAGGREAALLLAERLMQQREYREAELLLQQVRRRDDAVAAARAVEMLGRLMTLEGLLPDAVHYYRILRRDFGKTKLPDGRTGADVWDALSTDKRFLPYLDEQDPLTLGKFKGRKELGDFPLAEPIFQFEHDGEDAPFFRRHLIGLGPDPVFHLRNASTGEDHWRGRLPQTAFQALLPGLDAKALPRFRYHALGHLIVLPVDHVVFVIDPLTRRVLWEKDIFAGDKKDDAGSPALGAQRWSLITVDPIDGSTRVAHADGWVQHLGQHLVLSPSVLCLSTRTGLQAFEPRTGQLLWSRTDVPSNIRIFGDEDHIFLVRENEKGQAVATRVLRLADGGTVPAADFAVRFRKRVQVFGRTLLLSEKSDTGAVTLRQYDMLAGADVWKTTYPPRSIILNSEDARWTGAVEPDGKVHVVDPRTHKEVMTGRMEEPAEHLRNVQTVHLLADRTHFYLACQAALEHNKDIRREDADLQPNVLTRYGLRSVPVNGRLYAFDRRSGEIAWYTMHRNQFLILEQFADLPVVFLTARSHGFRHVWGGRDWIPHERAAVIEKRRGTAIFMDDALKQEQPFYAVRFHPQAGTVEFVSPTLKIRCQPRP